MDVCCSFSNDCCVHWKYCNQLYRTIGICKVQKCESCLLLYGWQLLLVPVLQYEEHEDEPYPGWARFVGSLLVLSATLPIPLIFIIRLIWKKEERRYAAEWFVNFPKRCRAAWTDFKELCTGAKTSIRNRFVGNCVQASFQRYTKHRSWSPDQPPYVDIQVKDSLINTHTL